MRAGLTLALCFLALLPAPTLAGDWAVGLSGIPALTIPRSSYNLPSPRNRFSYSIGFFGILGMSPDVFLKASLHYVRRGVLMAKGIPDTRSAIDPVTGRIDPSRIVYGDASMLFESVNMPVTVNFRFWDSGGTSLAFSGGMETGYLFYQRYILEPTATGKTDEGSRHHGFIVGVIAGITGLWRVAEGLTILMSPGYSYCWYPKADFGSVQFHTFGVELGICFDC